MPLPRVGLEERGTPMLDARTARILAKENEEDIEARRRREMVERCEKNIEKAVNEADSMRSSSSAVLTMPSGERWRSCAGGGLRLARRFGGKASSNTETYISRDGEGRAYTQARASEWVPFFMMDMWIPVLLPM